jgi:hypothetical protein
MVTVNKFYINNHLWQKLNLNQAQQHTNLQM